MKSEASKALYSSHSFIVSTLITKIRRTWARTGLPSDWSNGAKSDHKREENNKKIVE